MKGDLWYFYTVFFICFETGMKHNCRTYFVCSLGANNRYRPFWDTGCLNCTGSGCGDLNLPAVAERAGPWASRS